MVATGTMLGPYEILGLLGKGGMGEVYRAQDSRLGRTVAIKVVSDALASRGESRERFLREARLVSTLSHANIGRLYDIGNHNGTDFLVLEFLEGNTLNHRLQSGKLRLPEALAIAIDIASALDAAHNLGIIHRDLKPANVMLTRSGAKLMDFGLAKPTGLATDLISTMSLDSPLTRRGSVVGTLHYMSPEQVEGLELTPVSDIFSFGTMLYEMLAGKRPFEGNSMAALSAAILQYDPPPIRTINPALPVALERILRKCLIKDPHKRWKSAADLKDELSWISETDSQADGSISLATAQRRRYGMSRVWSAGFAILVLVSAALFFLMPRRPASSLEGPMRFSIYPPAQSGFTWEGEEGVSVSPDGEDLAFTVIDSNGKAHVWMRSIRSFSARKLQGTEDGLFPFWSPDSKYIGFFANGQMKKVSVESGASISICEVGIGTTGGTWNANGDILVGDAEQTTGGPPTPQRPLSVCPESGGGSLHPLQNSTTSERWPSFLPDGRHFVYLAWDPDPRKREVMLGSLDSKIVTRLLDSAFKAIYGNGALFFVRDGSLMAQKFDLGSYQLKGEPTIVAEHVSATMVPGVAGFGVGNHGVVAFLSAREPATTQLTWVSREGVKLKEAAVPGFDVGVSLSPDQSFALIGRQVSGLDDPIAGEAPMNVWRIDLERSSALRLTFGDTNRDENPIPSPKADRFVFASHRGGAVLTYIKPLNGTGSEEQLLGGMGNPHPIDWSPDGRYILFHVFGEGGLIGLSTLDLNGPKKLTPFVQPIGFSAAQGQFSPDGHFIAYTSFESGRPEVYVQTFPENHGKWQVSVDGAVEPRWRSDGREIYFVSADGVLMAVPIRLSPFQFGRPVPLLRLDAQPSNIHFYGGEAEYAPSRDGTKFLINRVINGARQNPINIVLNWSLTQTN